MCPLFEGPDRFIFYFLTKCCWPEFKAPFYPEAAAQDLMVGCVCAEGRCRSQYILPLTNIKTNTFHSSY